MPNNIDRLPGAQIPLRGLPHLEFSMNLFPSTRSLVALISPIYALNGVKMAASLRDNMMITNFEFCSPES